MRELYSTEDDQAFAKLFERIQKGEEGSDRMENEIGRYLGDVGDAHLSDETKLKIRAMLRQIGELESVGDGCFNLARIIRRKREHKIDFTPRMEEGIQSIFSLVEEALERMNTLLSGRREDYEITESEDVERRINACRNALKQQNIDSLDAREYDYDKGTVFADLISECEKTGDYIINVVEARGGLLYQDRV